MTEPILNNVEIERNRWRDETDRLRTQYDQACQERDTLRARCEQLESDYDEVKTFLGLADECGAASVAVAMRRMIDRSRELDELRLALQEIASGCLLDTKARAQAALDPEVPKR